jgi:hypothetical protein
MARGRRKGVRVSTRALDKARAKLKETPKRGRWPKFADILDKKDYIRMFNHLEITFAHPKYGNLCFKKECRRGQNVVDPNFGIELPEIANTMGAVRFYCSSYNREEGWIIDTCCRNTGIYSHPKIGCQRISCPYHKKGFVQATLESRVFSTDIENFVEKKPINNTNGKND